MLNFQFSETEQSVHPMVEQCDFNALPDHGLAVNNPNMSTVNLNSP